GQPGHQRALAAKISQSKGRCGSEGASRDRPKQRLPDSHSQAEQSSGQAGLTTRRCHRPCKLSCEAYDWVLKGGLHRKHRPVGKCCMVEIAASIFVVLAIIGVLLTFVFSRR